MPRSFVGIDIGSGNVKIAVREGNPRLISRRLPENLVSEDLSVMADSVGKFLAQVRSEEKINTKDCILVLGESDAYFRHVSMPGMTTSELELNLPYEFRDFIDGDTKDWVFDYAVDEVVRDLDEDGNGKVMQLQLFAAAANREFVDTRAEILRKAGFRLAAVIPAPMAYSRLLTNYFQSYPELSKRSAIFVDIGYHETTVLLYNGAKFQALRTINFGCEEIDTMIVNKYNVDRVTASNYKDSNYQGVLDSSNAVSIYDRMTLEVNKVVNFYNFSNPDANIESMFLLGGGSQIPQLVKNFEESFDIPVALSSQLLPSNVRDNEIASTCTLAYAGLLEGDEM